MNFALGFASSLAVVIFVWAWLKAVPAFLMRVQNEIVLARSWGTKFTENGKDYEETVSLVQSGRHVVGKIKLKVSQTQVSEYAFEGTFRHRVLTATYCTTNPSEYEQGAFALKYVKNRLEGYYILFSKNTEDAEDLVASRYEWAQTN